MLDVMLDPVDQFAPGPDDPGGKHIDPVAVLDPDGQLCEVQGIQTQVPAEVRRGRKVRQRGQPPRRTDLFRELLQGSG